MAPKPKKSTIQVQGREITILNIKGDDFISLTDMLKAKHGDFFISDWLRNRNTIEFLGIRESVHNPAFNYGEFATIKSQAGLNSYKISVKDWVEKTGAIGLKAAAIPILAWKATCANTPASSTSSSSQTSKV